MTCNQCGQPAEGALCRPCERAQRAGDDYDSVLDDEDSDDERPDERPDEPHDITSWAEP